MCVCLCSFLNVSKACVHVYSYTHICVSKWIFIYINPIHMYIHIYVFITFQHQRAPSQRTTYTWYTHVHEWYALHMLICVRVHFHSYWQTTLLMRLPAKHTTVHIISSTYMHMHTCLPGWQTGCHKPFLHACLWGSAPRCTGRTREAAASPLSPCVRLGRYLHYNQITTLPAGVFQGLTSLRELWVVACGWRLSMHVGGVCHGRQCVYCKLDTPQMAARTYVESCIWHVVRNEVCVCMAVGSSVCCVSVCMYIYIYICTYLYVCMLYIICMPVRGNAYGIICSLFGYVCMHPQVSLCTYMCVWIYTYTIICYILYMWGYVHGFVHKCVCTPWDTSTGGVLLT
jgi:hypothetical protein